MTDLKGQVKRRVDCRGITRPVIVILDAETKRIGFKELGSHKVHWIPIATAFAMAIRCGD